VVNGRFHIVRRIARGGMASVYFATQVPLSRPVAIKVVRCVDAGSEEDFRRRFLREASILAQLQHPNIVTLLDYGPITDLSEEHYFMAMEYLRGETLAKRFRRAGRMNIQDSIRLARQIGRGLREAHRRGFIHRDLKPSNIMLVPEDDKNDIVKLVDFGIGKIISARAEIPVNSDSEEMTRVGLLLGSPRYMSPEQIRSEQVELRTDLYGLGVILFQALTGRLPFEGKTEVEVLIAHCSVSPPALSDVCPDQFYPESLSRLVKSLLEKHPRNRPTIEEFLGQLAAIEEEVFGTISVAGPTLQGISALPPLPLRLDPPNGPLAQLGLPGSVGAAGRSTEVGIGHRADWDHLTEAGPGSMGMDLTPATVPALPLLPVVAPLLPPQISPPRRSLVFPALAALLVVVIVGLWVMVGGSRPQRPVGPPIQPVPSTATHPQVPRGMQTMAVMHTPNPDRVGGPNAEPTSFTLSIDSTPPDATVIEGGKTIGSTPMVVTIDRRSVSVGPRRFLVKRDGYAPYTLEQGDSKIAVSASATLSVLGHAGRDRPRRPLSKRVAAASVALERPTPPGDTPVVTSPESGVAPAPKHGGGPALEIRTRR
jgi:serine/threonine-protein kinase